MNKDYVILPDGTVADTPRKVARIINAWIDSTLRPNIPWIKGPGALHSALMAGRTLAVVYENDLQFWAHLRAALVTKAVAGWPTGHWRTGVRVMDPTTLLDTYLSPAGGELLRCDYLVVFAPEWPNTKISQEHANYILRQRDGFNLPSVLATRSMNSMLRRAPITWTVKGGEKVSNPTVCEEFRQFLEDDEAVEVVPLLLKNFREEIKNLNGAELPADIAKEKR